MTLPQPGAHLQPTPDDQLSIDTPEQVSLHFPIAGLGSRFLAVLTDSFVQGVAYFVLIFAIVLIAASLPRTNLPVSPNASKWAFAAILIFYFLIYWGYYSLFEAFWNGQTPGKRLLKIRVIKDSGRHITLFEALARNLFRVVDAMPGFYLVGVITMLVNRRQKRLGDLVAGTIVIHERLDSNAQPVLTHTSRTFTAPFAGPFATPGTQPYAPSRQEIATQENSALLPADAIARLHADDLNLIDTFLSRALDLDPSGRAQVAARVAARLCEKMQLPLPDSLPPERLLEAIAYAMRAHSRH